MVDIEDRICHVSVMEATKDRVKLENVLLKQSDWLQLIKGVEITTGLKGNKIFILGDKLYWEASRNYVAFPLKPKNVRVRVKAGRA